MVFWGQPSVHAENLLVDDGCDGQAIKTVSERLPKLDVISSLALIVESVNAVDRRALVVASEQEKVFWVFDLVCQQQTDRLQTLLSSIYVITQK